ncbi:MAG: Zn-dependent membrane protease YugP [Gammaproteobacteria bacterium]|jgi:Zn-dependent membrane protease YugP
MPLLLLIAFLAACFYLPSLWVKWVLKRHDQPRDDFPGTGGELAAHFVERLSLTGVSVEETSLGDHYNPATKTVGLSKEVFHGRSLTAVTVATHEIGHAIQHADGYAALETRTRWAETVVKGQKVGAALLMLSPIVIVILKVPAAGLLTALGGFLVLGLGALMHLVTLPTELDASFNRALPLLETGYIPDADMPAAKSILRAAAFTYVASALATFVNIWMWLRLLRR